MVLEKENWIKLPPDTVEIISFAGLVGDGAPLISSSNRKSITASAVRSDKSVNLVPSHTSDRKSGFSHWLRNGNPFLQKLSNSREGHCFPQSNGLTYGEFDGSSSNNFFGDKVLPGKNDSNQTNGADSVSEDENEDLLADFIDEDSQLPSRSSKPNHPRRKSLNCNEEENRAQTGSSLSLLRSMDKYARLMQKLEVVNVEFFKGICQLFEIFFYFVYEIFGQQNAFFSGKGSTDSLNYQLRTALSKITQDCDQWIKPSSSSPPSLSSSFVHSEVTPASPPITSLGNSTAASLGLKERCVAVDTILLVARILNRSKAHLQSMLLQSNATVLEDFYQHLVDAVPDLTEHIHRTTARLLLNINGFRLWIVRMRFPHPAV